MPKVRKRRELPNPVSEVLLRQHSTPYHFKVALDSTAGQIRMYSGLSWRLAADAYWHAVIVTRQFSESARVRMDLTEAGEPYGGFVTEIKNGTTDETLHIPHGECLKWAYRHRTSPKVPEKILATIPGMLGPIRHRRELPSRECVRKRMNRQRLTIGSLQLSLENGRARYSSADNGTLASVQKELEEYQEFIENWLQTAEPPPVPRKLTPEEHQFWISVQKLAKTHQALNFSKEATVTMLRLLKAVGDPLTEEQASTIIEDVIATL